MNGYRCLIIAVSMLVAGFPAERSRADPKVEAKAAEERIVLTESAAARVNKVKAAQPVTTYLRVSITDAGALSLDLDPVTDAKEDFTGKSQGIQWVVDRKSAKMLPVGIVVDYAEREGSGGFRFASPGTSNAVPDTSISLARARKDFKSNLQKTKEAGKESAPKPPEDLFQLVRYEAAPGKLPAYLSNDPKDQKKHPAIVWITGGDCNSIDAGCWRNGGDADQSASAYRKNGIVLMIPSLRGGNDNPGPKESFLGEVDDVLAAAAYLKKIPYVDPDRIYLGGHSTGGTLALLTAEYSDVFRAVFSFGPVDDVLMYGFHDISFSMSDPKELQLRSPLFWLHSIKNPVFVIEGTEDGNAGSLLTMAKTTKNPKVQFFAVKGANHFNVLGSSNRLIAEKIVKDTGLACNLTLTKEELDKPFAGK
ncbi:prolyl oligopeptidase family serine peptidase [Zavarzinella formosa]|uniref:prolyl oligopeptidase family serine peptidase n=1 Tax=Zavarzinella formosa TaxID=360055 RepID=UPI00031697F8|nr:prolyl oligopeptidase family serine peptidase [Zavarzinella formosa]